MNDRACLVCGQPLTGMRADAKYHSSCRTLRRRPEIQASIRFWRGIGAMRSRGARVWLRPR